MSREYEIEQQREMLFRRADTKKRRDKVVQLYLQGKTQYEMTELLGVSMPTIRTDLQLIHRHWRLTQNKEFAHLKWEQIRKIDNMEARAWECFELSKQIKTIKSTRVKGLVQVNQGTDEQPRWVYESPAERGQREELSVVGDVQWMKVIMWCITKRCEILGLDAPIKTDNTHTMKRDIGDMSDHELYESIMARRNASDGGRILPPHISA